MVVMLIVFIFAAEAIFLGWFYGPALVKAIGQYTKKEKRGSCGQREKTEI